MEITLKKYFWICFLFSLVNELVFISHNIFSYVPESRAKILGWSSIILVWQLVPFFVLGLIFKFKKLENKNSKLILLVPLFIITLLNFLVKILIVFFPQSSTDSIALFFIPLWEILIILPSLFLILFGIDLVLKKIKKRSDQGKKIKHL